jgi:hypothetical protein
MPFLGHSVDAFPVHDSFLLMVWLFCDEMLFLGHMVWMLFLCSHYFLDGRMPPTEAIAEMVVKPT